MLTFCFILGIFDGCFITMLGPIAFDLCGGDGAGQAIGFLLALCSIPLTIGKQAISTGRPRKIICFVEVSKMINGHFSEIPGTPTFLVFSTCVDCTWDQT